MKLWLRHKGINDIIENPSIFFRPDHMSICISTNKTQISVMGMKPKNCSEFIRELKTLNLHLLGRNKTILRMDKQKATRIKTYIEKCRKLNKESTNDKSKE